MNTAEDIKRMLGELVDEAIRIGRADSEKNLGTDAQLKEQVKRLVEDKRKLTQNLDRVNEENNDLELTIGNLKAELEWTENEIVNLRGLRADLEMVKEANRGLGAQIDSYERTRGESSKEIDRLTAQVNRYEDQLNMLHELRQKLEDENEVLRAKVDSYDGVSREQAKKVKELEEQVHQLDAENDLLDMTVEDLRKKLEWADAKVKELNEALAIYRVPTPRNCPFCGGPAEVHQLRKDEWYVACGNSDCPVNPETSCFDTETDAIEAWNNSYNAPKVTCDWR